MFEQDVDRTRHVALQLLSAYRTTGIFGITAMPEDEPPTGVEIGSEDHLRFITFSVAIDYQRDADQLWNAARLTASDPETRYLFDPFQVVRAGQERVIDDLQRYKLSRKFITDARTWMRIATTITDHFEGRVGTLIEHSGHDAVQMIELIRSSHYRGGFPFLKGSKIAPLWIRMLYDNGRVPFRRIGDVPLPIDIHTAQATVQTGCIRTASTFGRLHDLRDAAQRVWATALRDADDTYPLRLDEPLWLLSRNGCRRTTAWPCQFRRVCPVVEYCQPNHLLISVAGNPAQDESKWTIRS